MSDEGRELRNEGRASDGKAPKQQSPALANRKNKSG